MHHPATPPHPIIPSNVPVCGRSFEILVHWMPCFNFACGLEMGSERQWLREGAPAAPGGPPCRARRRVAESIVRSCVRGVRGATHEP